MTTDLVRAPAEIARYVLSTTDTGRRDRLWPANQQVFATNPLSVAYGACGTSLFLQQVLGEVPSEVRDWLLRQPLDPDRYPPGLYLGLAGVAVTFFELGLVERAESVMQLAYSSPLLYVEPSMVAGIAGWGWASLFFYDRTSAPLYLERAVLGGEYLIAHAESDGDTLRWRHTLDDEVHFGFGYGASGVALFLLELGVRTGDQRFLVAAERGLEHDLGRRVETALGWGWGRFAGDEFVEPYWLHGGSGVGTTVLRFLERLGDNRYRDAAIQIADGVRLKFTLQPGQWEGMSGVGDFLLDMFRCTGDQTYRDVATDIAETILWYRLERAGGWAFPGVRLEKICTDYATGAAGIGLFLKRLMAPAGRLLIDLDARVSPVAEAKVGTEATDAEAVTATSPP